MGSFGSLGIVLFFSVVVHAQGAPAAQPSFLESMVPLLLMFGVFYFLVIRPQAKQRKEHQKLLGELKRGDRVITASGIFGTIKDLTETAVTLEVANGVAIRILRSQVAGPAKEGQ